LAPFKTSQNPRPKPPGGPPYYTNDPGTPGNLNWEINLGYMPDLTPEQVLKREHKTLDK